ncbi:MAG: hypothetical protein ACR9NN_08230 [Nostochopsis sp.]
MTNTVAPKGTSMIQQMRKVITILILTAVIAISFNAPSYAADSLCTSVTSSPSPQSGEKNRSSGNFSTQNCEPRLKWEVAPRIIFNVMRDKSAGKDPVILSNVNDGKVTDAIDIRSLYIANPQNATENFEVKVYKTDDPTN